MFYSAKKLVIVTEHFLIEKVCKIIEACNGKGYTILRAGGKGLHHIHSTSEKATVIEGFDTLKVEVITADRDVAETIATRIMSECFEDYSGVIYLEDVEVCRLERF